MTSKQRLMEHNPTKLGRGQYECPLWGEDVGIILVVGTKAYYTDMYDVMGKDELDFYTQAATNGELVEWNEQ